MTGPDLNPSAALGSPAPTGHALAAEATPPQALAARMDGDAARYRQQADLASRTLNVIALNYAAGRSDGALAAAREVTQVLGPKWDALQRELTEVAAHAVIAEHDRNEARQERDVYRASAVMHCRERDEARAEADRLRPLEAEAQRAHGEATRLGVELTEVRADLSRTMTAHAADVTRLTSTQGHRERLNREAVTLNRELNRLTAELATCRERNAAIAVQRDQSRNERDEARGERDEMTKLAIDTADRDEYQLVVREMLDWFWEPPGHDNVGADTAAKVARWRKRAGLEPS